MRLILVGSEYAGTTTLVKEIVKWRDRLMGAPTPLGVVEYHDHFTLPWVGHWDEISDADLKKLMELGPELKEMFQRYQSPTTSALRFTTTPITSWWRFTSRTQYMPRATTATEGRVSTATASR